MLPIKSKDPEEFQYTFRGGKNVRDLPGVIANTPEMPGHTEFISMWKPDEGELKALNDGHGVIVRVMNDGKPIFPMEICVSKHPDRILLITPPVESGINDEGSK